ncbi:MAG: hypothetical protein HQL52_15075 [Magnetococcales bacterium]|nr:hypothetical protein [Magnetococcales bacterium]
MEFLNLIPIGFLLWVSFKALKAGLARDHTDRYFQETKIKTGKKFCNWFGWSNANIEKSGTPQ